MRGNGVRKLVVKFNHHIKDIFSEQKVTEYCTSSGQAPPVLGPTKKAYESGRQNPHCEMVTSKDVENQSVITSTVEGVRYGILTPTHAWFWGIVTKIWCTGLRRLLRTVQPEYNAQWHTHRFPQKSHI